MFKSLSSRNGLIGTASVIAFLAVQSPVFSDVPSHDIDAEMVGIAHHRFAKHDAVDHQPAPPPSALRRVGSAAYTVASYAPGVVWTTAIKPTGRFAWTCTRGTYHALPSIGYGALWTLDKTGDALISAVTHTAAATDFTCDAVQDVRAGRVTKRDKAYEAASRTLTVGKNAFVWTAETVMEGCVKVQSPLARAAKWLGTELWEDTKANVRDMRAAYLDDTASSLVTAVRNAGSSIRAKVNEFTSAVSTTLQNAASALSAKVRSALSWFPRVL